MSIYSFENIPLVVHKLCELRSVDTTNFYFRKLIDELTSFLVFEATKNLETKLIDVNTPVAKSKQQVLTSVYDKRISVVSIMRAGNGMLESVMNLLPDVKVGFLGLYRDETTSMPHEYYNKIPNITGETVFIVDPMLATGGSLNAAVTTVKQLKPAKIICLHILGSKTGCNFVANSHPDIDIFVAAIDDELNSHNYIVPGLGDAGDRIYNSVC